MTPDKVGRCKKKEKKKGQNNVKTSTEQGSEKSSETRELRDATQHMAWNVYMRACNYICIVARTKIRCIIICNLTTLRAV